MVIINFLGNTFMVRFSVVLFCKAITAKLVGNISSEVYYFLTHVFL